MFTLQSFVRQLGDIRWWIILFFVLRLYGIAQPPLEVAHNWRQTTVAMVARNFMEQDANILLPRVDMAGEKSGITGMEFPLFNYLIYLVSLLFGYEHWYGRLINLLISSAGTWSFYRLSRRFTGDHAAFYATLLLMTSLWFTYARKIMPDTFSVSLVLMGLDAASGWLYERKSLTGLLSGSLLVSLGLLTKVPAGLILSLLPLLILDGSIRLNKRLLLTAFMGLALIPAAWWYGFHVPWLNATFGFTHFFMGKPMITGLMELWERPASTAVMFYENAMKFTGFALFVAGLIVLLHRPRSAMAIWFYISTLLFMLFMFRAGENFTRHSYYMIPFIPVMAVVAAQAFVLIRRKAVVVAVLVLVMAEGVLNQQHDFRIKANESALLRLEELMNAHGPASELVAVNSGEYPTPLYFAHRKGWLLTNDQLADSIFVNSLKDKGLRKIIVLKKAFGSAVSLPYEPVFEDDDFLIYVLP